MKFLNKLFFILFFNVIYQSSYTQINNDDVSIKEVYIYLREWNATYVRAGTSRNFKDENIYSCFFKQKNCDFSLMFDDFIDCDKKLKSSEIIDSIGTYRGINSMVEMYFTNNKTITLCFDGLGNYLYFEKWYKCNYNLYYLLFKYFSNELIPIKTLKKAKNKFNGGYWN